MESQPQVPTAAPSRPHWRTPLSDGLVVSHAELTGARRSADTQGQLPFRHSGLSGIARPVARLADPSPTLQSKPRRRPRAEGAAAVEAWGGVEGARPQWLPPAKKLRVPVGAAAGRPLHGWNGAVRGPGDPGAARPAPRRKRMRWLGAGGAAPAAGAAPPDSRAAIGGIDAGACPQPGMDDVTPAKRGRWRANFDPLPLPSTPAALDSDGPSGPGNRANNGALSPISPADASERPVLGPLPPPHLDSSGADAGDARGSTPLPGLGRGGRLIYSAPVPLSVSIPRLPDSLQRAVNAMSLRAYAQSMGRGSACSDASQLALVPHRGTTSPPQGAERAGAAAPIVLAAGELPPRPAQPPVPACAPASGGDDQPREVEWSWLRTAPGPQPVGDLPLGTAVPGPQPVSHPHPAGAVASAAALQQQQPVPGAHVVTEDYFEEPVSEHVQRRHNQRLREATAQAAGAGPAHMPPGVQAMEEEDEDEEV